MERKMSRTRQRAPRRVRQPILPAVEIPSFLPSDMMRAAHSLAPDARKRFVDALDTLCNLTGRRVLSLLGAGDGEQPFVWVTELGFSNGERVWRMKLVDAGWRVERAPAQHRRGRLSDIPPGLSRRYRSMLRNWQTLRVAVQGKAAHQTRWTRWNVTTANNEWQALTAELPWVLGRQLRVENHDGQLMLVGIRRARKLSPFELSWDEFIKPGFQPAAIAKQTLAFLHDTGVENIRTLLRPKK
jgi:hypothetical protein